MIDNQFNFRLWNCTMMRFNAMLSLSHTQTHTYSIHHTTIHMYVYLHPYLSISISTHTHLIFPSNLFGFWDEFSNICNTSLLQWKCHIEVVAIYMYIQAQQMEKLCVVWCAVLWYAVLQFNMLSYVQKPKSNYYEKRWNEKKNKRNLLSQTVCVDAVFICTIASERKSARV